MVYKKDKNDYLTDALGHDECVSGCGELLIF